VPLEGFFIRLEQRTTVIWAWKHPWLVNYKTSSAL